MTATTTASPLLVVSDPKRAELLLHPLRGRILEAAREPGSAAEIARRIGETPQKVNYHVRALEDGGFLELVEERRRRNLVERRFRATARRYALSPAVLGNLGIAPGGVSSSDALGAAHLLGLASLLQEELAAAVREASERASVPGAAGAGVDGGVGEGEGDGPGGEPAEGEHGVPTLALDAELRLVSPESRGRFARALREAVGEVVARFARKEAPGGAEADRCAPAEGRVYRMVLGVYPIPGGGPEERDTSEGEER